MNILNEKIISGINMFSKMTALRHDKREIKYVQDELDLIEALEFVRQKFHETAHLNNKPLYKNQKTFDFIGDIKREIEEYYNITGGDFHNRIVAYKKYGAMLCLVIDPVLNFMSQFEHHIAVEKIDDVIGEVISYIKNNEITTHYDDAIVIKQIVRKMIQSREENKKHNKKRRKNFFNEENKEIENIEDFYCSE